ncbi:MAG: peptide chain release factor 2 [Anaerolineaceae bacterium]|nr:peptide chain release factor 2 [Anaerolineaceae bacterium]HNX45256.1 peptide chain release factor 2 [Anaerolineaceae bacterium]HPT23964.1 peptide chain release factor 2 [Anaerolineaceae bacterium]
MSDLSDRVISLSAQCRELQEHLDLPYKKSQLQELQKHSQEDGFWDTPDQAQKVMKSISSLENTLEEWENISTNISGLGSLVELDDGSLTEEIISQVDHWEALLARKETEMLLSGPYDHGNALLAIHSGAGGTDSQDWAAMLERMYLRWAERKGYKTEILDRTLGEEAGIKSVTIYLQGELAYGYTHCEKGVHRLVRLSPFDAAHRRHTSFALVEVLPDIEDNTEVIIRPEDIEIEVYKSSGAGGQNVQKNMTAVRIIHLPTGMVVTCQNERSQTQNRESALKVLRARLFELQQQARQEEVLELKGEFKKVEWGSQIRSYVLHPYQMVKDHRTEYETGNTQAVLDGDLDGFIEAYLKFRR